MEHQLVQLSNGIRVVSHRIDSPISHACILINAGARDEQLGTYGLAHFIEHLLFKRTERRSTRQILNRLETVGGDLNAYTTKEYTCIHASFLTPHLGRALDLFEDLCFHSVFPEVEMKKEKGVILDEIASYLDSPEEAIMDDFEDQLFHGHALGHNILGTADDLKRLTQPDIAQFIQSHYSTQDVVIGISGNHPLGRVKAMVQRVFGNVPARSAQQQRLAPKRNGSKHVAVKKAISQTHFMLGGMAYDVHHANRMGLLLLNNMLGGMGMTSRLNMLVREKHGIAYSIESNYTPLSDAGVFQIYFGTDEEKTDKALRLVKKELKQLRERKLGIMQLHQAKQKFKGQIALGEENRLGLILSQVKNVLDYGEAQSLPAVFAQIDAINAEQLQDIAQEIFSEDNLSSLCFLPG